MENLENNVVTEEVQAQETKTEEEVKTFTQEEVNEMIAKRVAREAKKIAKEQEETLKARLEAERLESEKLAKMNEADRARALAEKREKELIEREEKLLAKERELEQSMLLNVSKDMLAERGLSIEFSKMILASSRDAESIKENIDIFKKNFDEAVEKAVSERLRGSIPKTKSSAITVTKEEFKKMNLSERTKLYNDNPELYKELMK